MTSIIAITDDLHGNAGWLAAAEALHRQLRPDVPHPYGGYMRRMFGEGAEMAVLEDDLVTDEAQRGRGYGSRLIAWCEERARARGCDVGPAPTNSISGTTWRSSPSASPSRSSSDGPTLK